MEGRNSYFDGGLIEYLGISIVASLIAVVTFGLLTPVAYCMIYRWEVEHTVVEGKRLGFDGKAGELFIKWIIWFILIVITFGIYGFVVNVRLKQWKAEHTYFIE